MNSALFIEEPERPATASEQEQRIREYPCYRAFDAKAQEQLKRYRRSLRARRLQRILETRGTQGYCSALL